MDDKYGSEHQASEMAVWSDDDSAPNYGAILRVCQDGLEAASGSGGVRGAHIEQTVALRARRTYSLSFWAAALDRNSFDPDCAEQHRGDSWALVPSALSDSDVSEMRRGIACARRRTPNS